MQNKTTTPVPIFHFTEHTWPSGLSQEVNSSTSLHIIYILSTKPCIYFSHKNMLSFTTSGSHLNSEAQTDNHTSWLACQYKSVKEISGPEALIPGATELDQLLFINSSSVLYVYKHIYNCKYNYSCKYTISHIISRASIKTPWEGFNIRPWKWFCQCMFLSLPVRTILSPSPFTVLEVLPTPTLTPSQIRGGKGEG